MFLTGRSSHQIDDKGRIRIPAKFKDALGPNPYVTIGKDHCLYIFPRDKAERILSDKFDGVDGYAADPRLDVMREIFSNGDFVEEDKQGRITLPSYLLGYGKIRKNVISIGVRDRVELWSEEVWREYENSIDLDDIFNSMGKEPKAD